MNIQHRKYLQRALLMTTASLFMTKTLLRLSGLSCIQEVVGISIIPPGSPFCELLGMHGVVFASV